MKPRRLAPYLLLGALLVVSALMFLFRDAGSRSLLGHGEPQSSIPSPVPAQVRGDATEMAWSSRVALDGPDLKEEFDRAMAQNTSLGWMVARDIADQCVFTLEPERRNALEREGEKLQAEAVNASDRAARLAHLAQRRRALEDLRQRCRGFNGHTVQWVMKLNQDVEARVSASNDALGRLKQAEALARKQKTTATEFYGALAPVLLSSDPYMASQGLQVAGSQLYDFYLPPPQRDQVPSAFHALALAWEEATGERLENSQRDRLTRCYLTGGCGEERILEAMCSSVEDAARCRTKQAEMLALKDQYLAVLRSGKLRDLADVKPKGWNG